MNENKEFLEVQNEPLHKQQFENNFIRVYNVAIPPKSQCMHHRHSQDTFYISMKKVIVKNIPYNSSFGTEGVSNHTEGEVFYRYNRSQNLIHKVENLCDDSTLFVGMEIKVGDKNVPCEQGITNKPDLKIVLENNRVRAYQINLNQGKTIENLGLRLIGVLAFQNDSDVQIETKNKSKWSQKFVKGEVLFLDDSLQMIQNKNSNLITFYIVQIKSQKTEEEIIEENTKKIEQQQQAKF